MEDNLQLEEQVKKKKRVMLLILFTLLLVTVMTAALLEPTDSGSPEVVLVSPTQPATPITNVATSTATPSGTHGDEWNQSSPSPPASSEMTLTATTSTPKATQTVEPTRRIDTPTITMTANGEGTEANLGSTPEGTKTSPTATIASPGVTAIAEILPTTDPDIQVTPPSTETNTETEGDPQISTSEAVPAATEISKRINESWDVLDEYESSITDTLPLPTTLTNTNTFSGDMAAVPPNGLPVTGISTRRGMNWAAVAMVVLLLGVGVVALLYPQSEQK